MATQLTNNFSLNAPKHLDSRYYKDGISTPYISLQDAFDTITYKVKKLHCAVLLNGIETECWFKDGINSVSDLVEKVTSVDTSSFASKTEVQTKAPISNQLVRSIPFEEGSVLMLTDSFGESVGASSYINGFAYKTMRAIMNASKGYGYPIIINAANATNGIGVTTNGTYLTTGVATSRIQLTVGQTVTITNRSFKYCDFFYDAAVSSGTVEIRINGSLITTKTLTGSTGIQNTFPTDLGVIVAHTDTITLTATATVVITGLETLMEAYGAPLAYLVSRSGYGYQDYISTAALDELATYINFSSGTIKTVLLALGTNNIYSPDKAVIPSDLTPLITTLTSGINSRCGGNVRFIITIPARANESVFPVINSTYSYQNYVDAILSYCTTNNYTTIRYDQTQLGTGDAKFLTDGVHPNNTGHSILVNKWCETLGISSNSQNIPQDLTGGTVTVPDLSTVTNKGNITSDLVMITGNNKVPSSGEGVVVYYDSTERRGHIDSYNWTNPINRPTTTLGTASNVAIGADFAATAKLHLAAGTNGTNDAFLKFTAGALLVTPEDGAVEYDGTDLYITSAGVRQKLNIQATIANLQNSTNGVNNNKTSNVLLLTGSDNIPISGIGLNIMYLNNRGQIFAYDWGGGTRPLVLQYTGANTAIGGDFNPTAILHLVAGTSSNPSLRIPDSIAPTSPNDGDTWFIGDVMYRRIGGVTKSITFA